MQILQVIPITKSINAEVLTYFSAKVVEPGQLVTVPLRKKEISAIVVSAESVVNMKTQLRGANYQIRNVLKIHAGYVFSPAFLKTCDRMKNFYATSTGRTIEKFTPTFVLKNLADYTYGAHIEKRENQPQTKLLQKNYNDRVTYYKTLIREKLLQKESIHIICPTIQSCQKLFLELEKNNRNCFTLHSGLTAKQSREHYSAVKNTDSPSILISTSLYIDTYQYKKNTIIIEQDSSEYYRSITAPFVDSRVFIQEYAQHTSTVCILADTILRPESWYQHTQKKAELIEPFNKKIFKVNDLEIINQHITKPGKLSDAERIAEVHKKAKKKFSMLSKELTSTLIKSIENKEKIFLFSPKKSLAPSIVCNDCGNIARSAESGLPYSLYIKTHPTTRTKQRIFICNTTGESIPAFDTCQFCGSWNMQSLGIGTEGIFNEIQLLFSKVETHIIDGTHVTTKKQMREIIQSYESTEKSIIIIGTQKALPQLPYIDTSIIVSLDSYFARMSYSIHSDVLTLITRIIEKTKNPVLLQSRNITQESLPILTNGLYRPYIETELAERKEFNYPPYVTLCMIKKIIPKDRIKKDYKLLNELFNDYSPQILVHPGKTKSQIQLIVIIELNIALWNKDTQDQKLWQILSAFDRKTEVRINPKDLL